MSRNMKKFWELQCKHRQKGSRWGVRSEHETKAGALAAAKTLLLRTYGARVGWIRVVRYDASTSIPVHTPEGLL